MAVHSWSVLWRRCSVRCMSTEFHSFKGEYGGKLPEAVLDRLNGQGITKPNELQLKCVGPLLGGGYEAAVINAETGSGKTLCFLLPILKLFADISATSGRVPSPSSLLLVPTPHLGYQIQSVYQSLANPSWGSCVAHHSVRLLVTSTTSLVIATPTALTQYPLSRVLKQVQLVCVDEADILLTGSEQDASWTILHTVRGMSRDGTSMNPNTSTDSEGISFGERRFIFVAATLPSGGRQTVQSQLQKWLPKNTLFVKTDSTHKLVPNAELEFVNIDMTTPTTAGNTHETRRLNVAKQRHLVQDLCELHLKQEKPQVLIFCNSVSSAERLYVFLSKPQLATPYGHSLCWWTNKVGQLYKREETTPLSLQETLMQFRRGELRVLVCSDLGCRGLDLPDVTAVIQYDFPGNVAEFLHRAGRTARAGKTGHVISYVSEDCQELANEIRDVTSRGQAMDNLFSRNKMLGRKFKRRGRVHEESSVG